MENSSVALDKLTMRLNFSKLGVHIESDGLLNFDPFYLEMLYKVILVTTITINSTIKLIYIDCFVLIVVIPWGLPK